MLKTRDHTNNSCPNNCWFFLSNSCSFKLRATQRISKAKLSQRHPIDKCNGIKTDHRYPSNSWWFSSDFVKAFWSRSSFYLPPRQPRPSSNDEEHQTGPELAYRGARGWLVMIRESWITSGNSMLRSPREIHAWLRLTTPIQVWS